MNRCARRRPQFLPTAGLSYSREGVRIGWDASLAYGRTPLDEGQAPSGSLSPAFTRAVLELSITYRPSRGLYLRPHLQVGRTLEQRSPALLRSLDQPRLGLAIGKEF